MSLAEVNDSFDYSYITDLASLMHEKYPNEQPEEICRRRVAGLATKGFTIDDIVSGIVSVNKQLKISKSVGGISSDEEESIKLKIKDRVSSFWPSSNTKR